MTPNSKKVSKSPSRKRKPYIAPKPQKPTIWSKIAPGLAMLRYRPPFQDFKVSTISRKIKSASTCVVAPVYVAVEEFSEWSPDIVENICEIGREVHRLTVQQLKLRGNSSYPIQCVCPTFFLNLNRVTILVRPCLESSPLHGGVRSSLDDTQLQMMHKLFSDNHGVVLQCTGKSFAFWKDKNKFYALIPEGFRDIENRLPTLLKAADLKTLLEHSLRLQSGACSLYSVKVLNKMKIPKTLEKINDEFKLQEVTDAASKEDVRESVHGEEVAEAPPQAATGAAPLKTKKNKKQVQDTEPVEEVFSEDMILTLSADYKDLPDKRGILVGKEYCKDPDRIPHTVIAAAVFLHHFPANLWTSIIIHDIMKLGKRLFSESEDEDLLDNEDWMDRIKYPIKFMKKNLSINLEKLVFGKVTSVEVDVLSVEQGLMKFFDGNDTGILVGPQMVLVWQQKNNFFMFDPKERDGLGRKWTRMFSSELGSTALAGSACVTWYRNPKKLAEVYVESIALKHRKDPYRVIKVKFFESSTKPDDEGEWRGMSENKWMLFGTKTLCDYSYAEDSLRSGKAICMGISALMTALEKPEIDWESETIDKVLSEGIELLKLSLPSHETGKPFNLQSIKTMVDIGQRRVRFTTIDCKIHGAMLAEAKGSGSVQLKNGLAEFFNSANHGMFTVKDIALAIWRGHDNHYYLFYPYEKLLAIPPQCLCENEKMLPPMGIANAMRFKTTSDIFLFLTTCLNTKDNDEYCLSPIDIGMSAAADRPPVYEYEEFGTSGAIIRPFKDLHEGHEVFGVRADKQTLANLLTALGFNRINSSINWTKEDLADILKIGDKLFCKIYMGLPECQARDYKLQWEDVVPIIGMNKFTFTRQPIVGVLEILPEVMGEEGEHEMNDQEDYEHEEGIEAQDDELFVPPQAGMALEAPPASDLRGILQSWDKKKSDHHEAVLESDFYKIAIWKRDDLYFVFDPKASGENGELTERRIEVGKDQSGGDNFSVMAQRLTEEKEMGENDESPTTQPSDRPLYLEKRTYTQFANEGSAYSAWFSNFEEFFAHIFAKTPQDFKYGKFTLHDLTLTSIPVVTDDFEFKLKPGYHSVGPNHSILRGSMTQNSTSLMNRNRLEITNCIVAIAFARITPSSKMTTTLLDVLLKYGDRLYSKSLSGLKKTDMTKLMHIDKLSLEEISSVFSIYKIRFKWKINSTINGNLLLTELKKATGKLGAIEGGSAMILNHKGYIMAFWKGDGSGFYLYDPFETNPNGVLVEHGGLPSMSKFSKVDNLLNYLISKFICIVGSNKFTLYTIGIESAPVEKLNSTIPVEQEVLRSKLISCIATDQNIFQPYQTDMRILKSSLISDKIPQHGLALAALIHSQLQFVELWNTNISHRISFLARYLLQKTDCEIELLRSPASFDDIRCNFVIDNEFLCHIVFTKNIQGPICSTKRTEIVGVNLKNALTMFFKSCQQVVVFLPETGSAFALWKDNGVFYLFGVHRIEREIFVIASSTLPSLYDIILKGTNPEEDLNNWYELRSVTISIVPLKEGICKPLNIIDDIVEGPWATRNGNYFWNQSKEPFYFDRVSEKPEGVLIRPQASEFLKVSRGIEILYSRDILKSHRFYGTKDFFPSLQAACVEASALARIRSPTLWTKKTLEKILFAGANLYINTVAVKGTSNIQIVDFNGNFYLSNQKLEVNIFMPTIEPACKNELLKCLTWILRKYQMAYLYSKSFCFTLILENVDCFLYYPGSNEIFDNLQNLSSCLIKFCSISDLLDRLLNNKEISLCEKLFIGPIFICTN